MASLSSLLEDWKNYKKNIEWQLGRGDDIANQNDVNAIEDWERWQGVGPADIRGLSGLAGAIKASHGSSKIKDYIQSLRQDGNYFYDDKKNLAYEKNNMPTGEWWQVHEIYPSEEGGNQELNIRNSSGLLGDLHRSLEDAISSVKKERISQALKSNYNKKYGDIPQLWDGFEQKTAKALIDAGIGIDRYSRSSQSKSHYLYLDNGLKIRISDHNLPSHYDQPDIDFSSNGNIQELLSNVQDLSNNLKNNPDVPIESLADLLRRK